MTKFCVSFVLTLLCFHVQSQVTDNFSDGDYTHNPAWQTTSGDFIINADKQLQSNNTTASSTFYISTANALITQTEWEFRIKIDFNPSSANYVDVWLGATTQDLTASSNEGYFVRVGSTDDDICLYKKPSSGNAVKIIDGINGLLNTSSNSLMIKVIRTSGNRWILLRDATATGNSYRSEGEVTDNDFNTSSYFGFLIKQSTASFFLKHFFDDIIVKPFDGNTPPAKVISATAVNANTVKVVFDKPVNTPSAEDVSHYFISGPGNPISATPDAIDGSVVLLTFSGNFTPNQKNTMIVTGVSDIFGNTITDVIVDFYYYKASRYEVVINEVFADPQPQIGLPTQKFLELRNNATFPVNLKDWQLRDGSNTAILPAIDLKSDSFLIITTSTGLSAYQNYGTTISVSGFPSLNIGGGQITLYDESGSVMHTMSYDLTTYQNELKKDGGYSLELIDAKTGCLIVGNWTASNDVSGGTPGRKNSVAGAVTQSDPDYKIINAFLSAPDTLYLLTNKSVDSSAAAQKNNYILSDGLSVSTVEVLPPFFNTIRIALTSAASENKIYTVKVNSLTGCDGNSISNVFNTAKFGIAKDPSPGDILINEILFDPISGGSDYVELYNNSTKIIDLRKVFLANRNTSNSPSSFSQISAQGRLLLPGDFALLTTDPVWTGINYPISNPDAFVKMNTFPSYPDASGNVLITDQQGNIIDEVAYNSKWHFPLIKDKEGVALERIAFNGPSDQTNFRSASKDVSYGTPGLPNSQSRTDAISGEFTISPEVFSPDNDGTDDFLTITYSFPSGGFMTNIKIFDAQGRMVRYLEKNSLSGVTGYYRWDGLDDKQQKLPQGIYIIHFESFNTDGVRKLHKKSVVLARRF
ncbi:MAG: lamin tail domain-containing protein [Chitinophagaceae bacterium]|nr:lamin tail domain-containing protein [Chitinophagaceae bacterium]